MALNITYGVSTWLWTSPFTTDSIGELFPKIAKMGFDVTGTDLSENAIQKARNLDDKINFMVDDILNSRLEKNRFDYILDRGCFHVLPNDKWSQYGKKIHHILDENGLFFLKCFSTKETKLDYGPYRFSENEIRNIFGQDFVIESVIDTVYQGTLDPFPKALFTVMSKKKQLSKNLTVL